MSKPVQFHVYFSLRYKSSMTGCKIVVDGSSTDDTQPKSTVTGQMLQYNIVLLGVIKFTCDNKCLAHDTSPMNI